MNLLLIEFTYPFYFLLLPLPFLVYKLVPAYRSKSSAIKVPFFSSMLEALGETPREGSSQLQRAWWQRGILLLTWILVITALAKPTVQGEMQTRERFGHDIMVLVDLSGSMAEQDFSARDGQKSTRLSAAKQVLGDFLKTREGDRLGLILFGDAAFVQTPFTADQQVWLTLLKQSEVAMAGQSTHLGDAIGLAIKVFEDNKQDNRKEKIAIVLTDGNDTGSFVEPVDAAKVAAAKGVRIYMVAMGDPSTVGEQALDMETIQRVATESGGRAFAAINNEQLAQAYSEIGQLEPLIYESTHYRPKQSLHHLLIALLVILYLSAFSLAIFNRRRHCVAQQKDNK